MNIPIDLHWIIIETYYWPLPQVLRGAAIVASALYLYVAIRRSKHRWTAMLAAALLWAAFLAFVLGTWYLDLPHGDDLSF